MHNAELLQKCQFSKGTGYFYKTVFGHNVFIQGELEELFVKECESRNVFVADGISLDYFFEGSNHKYYIDFKINFNSKWYLVEIKNSYWYKKFKEQVEAKKKSAIDFCSKSVEFEKYLMVIDDINSIWERKG